MTFARIGLLSFGGPAGQIALMHRVLVEQKRWLDERTYLLALNFCTLLPGPEAMQLATYSGWRLHGVRGGLAAGLLFVAPGALVIFALSWIYAAYGKLDLVAALFVGVKAAVLAIVIEALLKISRRALHGPLSWLIAAAAFVAIFALHIPFPLIVLAAGVVGFFFLAREQTDRSSVVVARVPVAETLKTVLMWLVIWIGPLLLLSVLFGFQSIVAKVAVFFSTLAVVTFGGAYAVLAYMAQEAVSTHGWLQATEMLDGLGLAETTPGPLILVTEFVAFLAGYRDAGLAGMGLPPAVAALITALVSLWATFAPCFLYIFTGAPYIEMMQSMPRLRGALSAITAAVVGIILNLTVWFALHVLFAVVTPTAVGPFTLSLPDLATVDWIAVALALIAAALMFALHFGIVSTLAISAVLALALHIGGF